MNNCKKKNIEADSNNTKLSVKSNQNKNRLNSRKRDRV